MRLGRDRGGRRRDVLCDGRTDGECSLGECRASHGFGSVGFCVSFGDLRA